MGILFIVTRFPIKCEIESQITRTITKEGLNAKIGAVARGLKKVDECLRCETDEIVIFIPTSDIHIQYKLQKTKEQALQMIQDSVQYASDHVTTNFIAEDATRSDFEFLVHCLQTAQESGASRLVIADTIGTIYPPHMKSLIEQIKTHVNLPLSCHCHNDLGLATANTLAAVEGGVTYPQVTINSYGERAGNAPP
ncbi:MAG: hypothetical protein AYK19_07970 [Theionarchaea archaeon DG-70-1]|nr:MAG: hypothetical protein AYK19_07970 [Theionarchaea archaeon DG-70-1]